MEELILSPQSKKALRGTTAQTVVVILAAGKGTRMGRADMAKVCFEIDGVPAINRTIHTFRSLGYERFMLVVGSQSEQVQEAVNAEHGGVVYVYQSPQLGTGHAARVAGDALVTLGHNGHVLVTMGDKFIEPEAIIALRDGFIRQNADMALLSIPRTKASEGSGGRIFIDDTGQALDIIETTDLARQAIADSLRKRLGNPKPITAKELETCIQHHLPAVRKQAAAVPELLEMVQAKKTIDHNKLRTLLDSNRYTLCVGSKAYTAAEIERVCTNVNPSLYYFKADAFYYGIRQLKNDNAQGEYYLTDTVKHLAAAARQDSDPYRVRVVPIKHPEWIQGFNSPDELLNIQDYVRAKKSRARTVKGISFSPSLSRKAYCSVEKWIQIIEQNGPAYRRWLTQIYGDHPDLHQSKARDMLRVLRCYGRRFGFDQKVCIVRAPGRINLMGRHVDHRGGYNNFLAIHRETLVVAGCRNDDQVVAVNVQPGKFAPVSFSIDDLIGSFGWTDWINFVNSEWVRKMLFSAMGDWGNYIKAAVLRLQHHYQDVKINGLNLAFYGDIPIAAGLSSSSSIVVATLQAGIALNNLQLTAQQFVDLCGQGEWFVGSRGGSGDHAAIYLGQRGKIIQVGYLPFHIGRIIESPPDYQVIIADSHIKAAKSGHSKHQFNARITAYNAGMALLRQRCPQFLHALEHVRDIAPEKLACPPSHIYEMLQKIPQKMTRKEINAALSAESAEMLAPFFGSHDEQESYPLRGVLLFGAAESARSRICPDLLRADNLGEFGRLMKISHNGDRVSAPDASGNYLHLDDACTDDYLNHLMADLISQDPRRVLDAQLYSQSGYYACSTPQIDRMVDLASIVPGVIGAQIAGAGLGGCIMILAHKDAVPQVRKKLIKEYYQPQDLLPAVIPCVATQGACLLELGA
jgi:N-acetylgalactosamine kinase